MSYVIIAILLLIIFSILAFILTGNSQLKAKEMQQEIITGTLGKMILGAFLGLLFVGVVIGMLILFE